MNETFPKPPFSALTISLLWSNRVLKVGPAGARPGAPICTNHAWHIHEDIRKVMVCLNNGVAEQRTGTPNVVDLLQSPPTGSLISSNGHSFQPHPPPPTEKGPLSVGR